MKYLYLLCLFCLLAPAQAEIYKGEDPKGQTIYSDENLPNTKKIPTPTDNVIQMPKLVIVQPVKNDEEKGTYVYLNIDKPIYDETVRDNQGNLSVLLSIKPALQTEDGHYIAIYLDDKEFTPDVDAELDPDEQDIVIDTESNYQVVTSDTATDKQDTDTDTDTEDDVITDAITMNIKLLNINRGMHNIYVEVMNEDEEALITSNSVKFHMKRQSIQHNKPFGASPGPQGVIFKPGPITAPPQ